MSSGRVASGFDSDREGEFEGGQARNRVVHELGHSYGLHHSVNAAENGWTEILWVFNDMKKGWCGEVADDDARDYPDWTSVDGDTVAAIGPMGDPQAEIWGIDPRYLDSNDALLHSAPQTNTSLMSYCNAEDQAGQARWIGKRDYLQLLTDDHGPISGDPDAGTGDTIRGVIAADGQSADLKPALAVDFAPTPDDPAGTHAVVLRNVAGGELWRTRFTPGDLRRRAGDRGLTSRPRRQSSTSWSRGVLWEPPRSRWFRPGCSWLPAPSRTTRRRCR